MRTKRNLCILVSAVFFLAGILLLRESAVNSEWYMDIFMFAGALISAMGLLTGFWALQRHLSIRRLEHHLSGHR
jgi:hypothetical protein